VWVSTLTQLSTLALRLAGTLAVASAAAGSEAAGTGAQPVDVQTVELISEGQLHAWLIVPSEVAPTDTRWLTIRFVNTGGDLVHVRNASYRIERLDFDLATGQQVSRSSLGSGNTYDLFSFAWHEPRQGPIRISLDAKQVHEVVDGPSEYATVLLGLDRTTDIRVEAAVHLSIDFGEAEARTPDTGVRFSFIYRAPDDADFNTMRNELRRLLTEPPEPENRVPWRLHAMLDCPAVTEGIEPLAFLKSVEHPNGSHYLFREPILDFLATTFGQHDDVVQFMLRRLRAKEMLCVRDLLGSPGIWDPSFIQPLVDIHEDDQTVYGFEDAALRILHAHRQDWTADESIPGRLSAAVVRRGQIWLAPEADRQSDEVLRALPSTYELLGMTGDPTVINLIRPGLDDQREVRERGPRYALYAPEVLPPLRVCDAALDAILTIRHGEARLGYPSQELASFRHERDFLKLDEQFISMRDEMIANMTAALDAD
jgi:hypothetical protein